MVATLFTKSFLLLALGFSQQVLAACTQSVTAKQGDTCASIASQAGITVTDFLRSNPSVTSCSQLVVGASYCVKGTPDGAPTSSTAPPQTSTPADLVVSPDGNCGSGVTCAGSRFGDCCSAHGFCGSTTDYCGEGCQAGFGNCGGGTGGPSQSPGGSITVTVTSITSIIQTSFVTQISTSTVTRTSAAATVTQTQTQTTTVTRTSAAATVTQTQTQTTTVTQPRATTTATVTKTIDNGGDVSTITVSVPATITSIVRLTTVVTSVRTSVSVTTSTSITKSTSIVTSVSTRTVNVTSVVIDTITSIATSTKVITSGVCSPTKTTTGKPTTTTPVQGRPTLPGTPTNCKNYDLIENGDTCRDLADRNKLSLLDFYALNPSINCDALWEGYYVCVGK